MTKSDTYEYHVKRYSYLTDKGQNCVSRMGNTYKILVDSWREDETQIYVYIGG